MSVLLVYPLLTAALFYLGSRAKLTQPVWSRYPRGLAEFMDCAACTGFWYGIAIELVIGHMETVLDLNTTEPVRAISAVFVTGLCSLVVTPMVAGLMQHSLFVLGSAVEGASDGNE